MKNLKCKCAHEFQDKQYGAGVRAHNLCKNGEYARCTVCRSEKDLKNTRE